MNKQNIENDELICPITLQLFYDPVKAKDGHIYERNAITKWILQHGTSPLTRQPLNVNDLETDENIKKLSRQRRNSTISYNSYNEKVTISSFEHIFRNTSQIRPQLNNEIISNNQIRNNSNGKLILIILFSFILPICFIIGIVIGLNNSFSQDIEIRSKYSSSLTFNNSYNRTSSNSYYYYQLYKLIITNEGFYGFEIESESSVTIHGDLYLNSINNTNINYTYNDQDSIKNYFGNWIKPSIYILLLTTYQCCNQGSFNILITGPQSILFYQI